MVLDSSPENTCLRNLSPHPHQYLALPRAFPVAGTFQDRKLVTGGKQASAVKQAQDAAAEARNQANAASALKG